MTNRTVKVELQAGTSGYTPPVQAAAAATKDLSAAQKESATSAKGAAEAQAGSTSANIEAARQTRLLTNAKREAAAAAKDATAADAEATRALTAAQKEAAAAAADTTELSAQRQAAANAALEAAQTEAAAAAEAKAASVAQAKASADALAAHRDETAAARENAAQEAASAKASEEAAAKRADAYKGTSKVALTAGTVLAGAFVIAEKATSDFNKSLSGVQAVSNASAADMDLLRQAALKAGKDTAYTATEAADAEGELVKAGVSVKDVLSGGLLGALSLAAAGQLNLSDAATISANAMNTFALKGSDVPHIADVLAAAANKSAADVQTLAYAMQQGGLVAAQTGLSFEDTTAVLAAFADRGLQGADAGTSLKTMLEKLNAPTTQAKDLMQNLGIVTYDAQGKFVGITQFAGELHDKLGDLTDAQRNAALSTIFGSDAIRAASVLYNLGAMGVQGYTQAVNDQGAAGRMASEQMDNLSGDLKQLRGSLDVALIQGGSGANSVLRDMAQDATKAVNAFAGLPKPLQEAAVGFSGGSGAALLLVGGLTSIAGKAASTKKTLSEVAEASSGMKGALASAGSFMAGPWGLAIAGAATVVGIFASQHTKAKEAVASFTDSIQQDGDAIGGATTKAVAADLAHKGLLDTYTKLGLSSATVTDAALGNAGALQKVADATMAAIKADPDNIKHTAAMLNAQAAVKAYSGALHDQLKSQQQATAATEGSTAATGMSAAETAKAAQAAKDAAAATYAQAAGQRAAADAHIANTDTTKDNTSATKDHSAAKVNNATATNAAAAAAKAHDAATKADTTSQKDAAKASNEQSKADTAMSKALTDAATAADVNGDANATAAEKKKANAAAAKSATTAADAQATADAAASRASDAASSAADKHTSANDKSAKAAKDAADASSAQAAANADAAKQAVADAQAAREAAEVHKLGTTWLLAVADAEAKAKDSARDLDDSVGSEVGAMKDAKDAASKLKDGLDALNGVHISAGKAALDEQQRVADLTKAFDDNGKSLDITTDAGRKNMTAIYALADAANSHAQAVTQESGSIDAGTKSMDASRTEFDAVLKAAGLTTDQINAFNTSLLQTPKLAPITLKVGADTSAADAALQSLENKYAGTGIVFGGGPGGKHVVNGFSTGGLVNGAGGPTSDSNMIAVSDREYIVNAAAVARPGVLQALNALNFGMGNATVVKPMIPMHSMPASASSAGVGSGAALHVENYFENGASPQATAAELAWLLKARGGTW